MASCISLHKFAVAEFPEEEMVEVVSTNWLGADQTTCYWPTVRGYKFRGLLLSHTDPLATSKITWEIYGCRILGIYGKTFI